MTGRQLDVFGTIIAIDMSSRNRVRVVSVSVRLVTVVAVSERHTPARKVHYFYAIVLTHTR